jgi:hypothetical protein
MLDYIMWPWSERSKIPSALQDKEFQFPKEKFPKLVSIQNRYQKRDLALTLTRNIT